MPPRVIVKFNQTTNLESRANELASTLPGGQVVRVSPRGRAVIAIDADADPAAAARALNAESDVEYAEADVEDHAV